MMKITILMPTYNDADSIVESLESLLNQSYANWELIIIDDGSTDNTREVVLDFINTNNCKDKIKYLYKENADQLNAIKYALNYIKGDFVYILHSDDLLQENCLYNFVDFELKNKGYDAYIGNKIIIDKNGKELRLDKTAKYASNKKALALTQLWLGRNLYIDFAFWKTEVFTTKVKNSYLDWNVPYWIDFTDINNVHPLKVINMNFVMFKYRIYDGNYINNEIGTLNVLNGEIRTLCLLLKDYYIPFYKLQYFIFRILNKLKISKFYWPFFLNKESKNKYEILNFAISKRLENYRDNVFFNSIVNFYKSDSDRTISFGEIPKNLFIYNGSDMRKFNKDMLCKSLQPFYYQFFNEVNKGFNCLECRESDVDKFDSILKFLCIRSYVQIKVKAI